MAYPPRDTVAHGRHVCTGSLESAFPDHGHAPAVCSQSRNLSCVPFRVARYLLSPELGPRCRPAKQVAIVSVPEAAVYKNGSTVLREYQVRPPGQCRASPVEAIPQTQSVQPQSKHSFRLCVPPADSGHHPGPRGCVYYINHQLRSEKAPLLLRKLIPGHHSHEMGFHVSGYAGHHGNNN